MDFYNKYLLQCQKRGESPSAAALNAGFTKVAVSRWKRGSVPKDTTLLTLADYFDCSIDDLRPDIEISRKEVATERREFLDHLIDKLTPQEQIDLIVQLLSKEQSDTNEDSAQ